MLKLTGILFVIFGCIGASVSICSEQKKRLETLKTINTLYENMKYFFNYHRATLPEILLKLSEDKQLPFHNLFTRMYEQIEKENHDFEQVWINSIKRELPFMALRKDDWKLLLEFPTCLGYLEGQSQARALDELIRETKGRIHKAEQEEQSNQKVILSLGTAAGIILIVILL